MATAIVNRLVAGAAVAVLSAATVASSARPPAAASSRVSAAPDYGALPLRFEPNVGQSAADVRFLSRGRGHTLLLTADEAVVAVRAAGRSLRLRPAGGQPARRIVPEEALAGKTHYYLGNDPSRWRSGVPAYGSVRYEQVYPGIDLVFHGSQRQLEYDFVVAPGADPRAISLSIEGGDGRRLTSEGDLVVRVGSSEVRQPRPKLYQRIDGEVRHVTGDYMLQAGSRVGFEVGRYDRKHALVIDPVITLAYSSFFGGGSSDNFTNAGIAVDAAGSAYITGDTFSPDLQANGWDNTLNGSSDIFVAKIAPSGDSLEWASYLGGAGQDEGGDIAIDPQGNAYLAGFVFNANASFPILNAFQPAFGGGLGDTVVAKLSADGVLVYSSYLGGSGLPGQVITDRTYERPYSVAVDAAGHLFVAGETSSTHNFPVVNAYQATNKGQSDIFVTKVGLDGTSLVYSTFIGGAFVEQGFSIAVDAEGAAYVSGSTTSADNPATPAVNESFPLVNALQPTFGGVRDAYVLKLSPAGNQLVFSTYLGGSGDDNGFDLRIATGGIAVDAQGYVYVAGTSRSPNFPTTPGRIQAPSSSIDFFVSKLVPDGTSLVYSTIIGGPAIDVCQGLALGPGGTVYVTGYSSNFPQANALPGGGGVNVGFGEDAVVAKLNAEGTALLYSTHLGGNRQDRGLGIAVDARGDAYITGVAFSPGFPLVAPFDAACTDCVGSGAIPGGSDAFVAKLALANLAPTALADGFATDEDAVLTVSAPGLLENDTDPNNDPLSAALVSGPSHGTLTLNADGSFSYAPSADFSGTDAFTYEVSDGQLTGGPATASITVTPVNDAPSADAGGPYSVNEGTTVTLNGSGSDVEGDALSYDWDLNNDGTYESPGQTVTFTAPGGPAMQAAFLRVTDAQGAVAIAFADVSILNVAPVAEPDTATIAEDSPLSVAAPGVLSNDRDVDSLTAILASGPSHGTLTFNADGSFVYTPTANFNGSDSFAYQASDGHQQSVATVSLTVTPVNDAPSVNAGGPYSVNEGESVALNGAGNDVDADTLSYAWDLDGDGTFESSGQTVAFSGPDGPATRTVSLRVSDANGAFGTASAEVSILNVAPVAEPDTASTAEDSPLSVPAPGVLANDRDFDPLTVVVVTGPAHGTLALQPDGSFVYTPEANFNGSDSFTYQASDGLVQSTATVSLTVTPVNDAPSAAAGGPYSVNEGGMVTLTGSGSDVEAGALSFAWDLDGNGTFEAVGASVTFHAGNGPAAPTVTLQVTDEGGAHTTAGVTVGILNLAPSARPDAASTSQDTPLTVAAPGVLGNDTDFDPLSALLVSGPAHGALTLNSDGSFNYVPAAGFSGTDSFSYSASDGIAASGASVTIAVAPTTAGPDAVDDEFVIAKRRHHWHRLPVLANDRPASPSGELCIIEVTPAAHGTVKIADGMLLYKPRKRFLGVDSFTYTIRDENGGTDTARVTVVVRKKHDDRHDDRHDDKHDDRHDDKR